jgi:methylase of polypeptide subunit release factors
LGRDDRVQREVRKEYGIYYTPRALVDIVFRELDHHLPPEAALPRVLEPACGAGAFLRPALEWMRERWPGSAPTDLGTHLVGVDRDERAVVLARQSLSRAFVRLEGAAPPVHVYTGDFLTPHADAPWLGMYDIVVGNPPFVSHRASATHDTDRSSAYRSRYEEVVSGETNTAVYFLVQALALLKPGGLLGMVIPRTLLRDATSTRLREVLLREAELLSVVDFGAAQVFDDPSITTALLFLRKRPSPLAPSPGIASASDGRAPLAAMSDARSPAVFTYAFRPHLAPLITDALRHPLPGVAVRDVLLQSTCVPSAQGPWLLLTGAGRQVEQRLTDGRVSFDDVARCEYAVDTMHGDALIFRGHVSDGMPGRLRVRSMGLGRDVEIAHELLRPIARPTQIERFQPIFASDCDTWLFYPYQADGSLIAESAFFEPDAPYAHEGNILTALRPRLRRVRAHRSGGGMWYAPGGVRTGMPWHRPDAEDARGVDVLVAPRYKRIPHVAPVSSSHVVPVGASLSFVVREVGSSTLLRVLALMNSSVMGWYEMMTTAKFGSGGFAERTKGMYRRLRLPETLFTADVRSLEPSIGLLTARPLEASAAQILRAEQTIDAWVYDALEIDRKTRDQIRAEVATTEGDALYRSAARRAGVTSSLEGGAALAQLLG